MTRNASTRVRRNPDWNGNVPESDAAARALIIDAALQIAERDGIQKINIKNVADKLCITRQTIYRLFPSTDDLLTQVSVAAGGKILERLLANAEKYRNFEDRVIESMVFLAWNIPNDDLLRQYFMVSDTTAEKIGLAFSNDSLDYSYQILKALRPENRKDIDDGFLRDLAEHQQRLLLGIIVAPSERIKTDKGLRAYLNQWLRPVLACRHQPLENHSS